MAHFAKIENGTVTQVIVAEADFIETLPNPSAWVQTSYNTHGGVHYDSETKQPSADQSKALRKNFAGIGFTYDAERDAFIPPQPGPLWELNKDTCLWEPPSDEEILQMAREAAPKIKLSHFLALAVTRQWVTAQEAEDFSRKVALPSVLVDAVDVVCMSAHPNDEQARAAMRLQITLNLWNLTEVGRLDTLIEPMVYVLASRAEPIFVTEADLDDVFEVMVS